MSSPTEDKTARALSLDGGRIAAEIKREVASEVSRLKSAEGITPCLAVVLVGEDPASSIYVRNKVRACEEVGIRSEHVALAAEGTSTAQLLELVASFNARDDVDGLLVQLPLPPHVEETRVLEAIDPEKDVDGFHPLNVGRLALGQPSLVPCTPAGVIELLVRSGVEIKGARACVVGRSQIVGRPVAQLLLQRDATVTIC
ncbi:MAG TPA: bifunctional 5,10-methylenetetrahydrofolate dehydrogenase/5,10-methenyltetrahydrofolate cyclohydrolase, partial [Pyrinomonadaceae bacterium]|nr:bifunctional 5,10-methylenetetrahydrofolate dehydrogenase/5,10-methenyltetrahydrofolate cyclohydrolase [Pyrinomonadaceae bacterium]